MSPCKTKTLSLEPQNLNPVWVAEWALPLSVLLEEETKGPRSVLPRAQGSNPELPTPTPSRLVLALFSSLAKLRGQVVFYGSKKRKQTRSLKWTQTLQYRSPAYTTVWRNVSKKSRSSSLQPPRLPGDLDLLPNCSHKPRVSPLTSGAPQRCVAAATDAPAQEEHCPPGMPLPAPRAILRRGRAGRLPGALH